MKFAHVSDLHLGIDLSGYSLMEDQKYILDRMLEIFLEQKVDAVIIAGDVYDKGVASLEAIRLFEKFLRNLAEKHLEVFVISGNHDTAERLSFGSEFMEGSGIHFSRPYCGKIESVVMKDEHGPLNIYLLPFVRPQLVRYVHPEKEIGSFQDCVELAVNEMEIDPSQRNVLVAHQAIINVDRCDSENTVIGNLDSMGVEVFEDFDYVALGHIHGPQTLGKKKNIRYCGTPLKYSLSEKDHRKSVTIVDMGPKGTVDLATCDLVPLRDVREVRGNFADVISMAGKDGKNPDDYVKVILTDENEILNGMANLRNVYPHIVGLSYDNERSRNTRKVDDIENVKSLDPAELFDQFYFNSNGIPMDNAQKEFVSGLISEIWGGKE